MDDWNLLARLAVELGLVTHMMISSDPAGGGGRVEIELLLTGEEVRTLLDQSRCQHEDAVSNAAARKEAG